jgi:nitrate/nitrite-specific signal transduction histidine kinase
MYLGLVPNKKSINIESFASEDIKWFVVGGLVLLGSIFLTTFCIFKISHKVIRPLRQLNSKMREILDSKELRDLSNDTKSDQCKEINELYDLFQDLIRNKKCIDNDFI